MRESMFAMKHCMYNHSTCGTPQDRTNSNNNSNSNYNNNVPQINIYCWIHSGCTHHDSEYRHKEDRPKDDHIFQNRMKGSTHDIRSG